MASARGGISPASGEETSMNERPPRGAHPSDETEPSGTVADDGGLSLVDQTFTPEEGEGAREQAAEQGQGPAITTDEPEQPE